MTPAMWKLAALCSVLIFLFIGADFFVARSESQSLNYLLKTIAGSETQEIKESLNLAEEEIKRLEIFGLSEYGKSLLFSYFNKKMKSVPTRRIKDYLKSNLMEEKFNGR